MPPTAQTLDFETAIGGILSRQHKKLEPNDLSSSSITYMMDDVFDLANVDMIAVLQIGGKCLFLAIDQRFERMITLAEHFLIDVVKHIK